MTAKSEIVSSLHEYLQLQLDHLQTKLTPEARLLEAGILDSLSIFKLVHFMEERFAVKIEAEDILVENFETIHTLAALVQSKQQ